MPTRAIAHREPSSLASRTESSAIGALALALSLLGACGWPYDNPLDRERGGPSMPPPKETFWMGFAWPVGAGPEAGEVETRLRGCVGDQFPRSAGQYTSDSTFHDVCRQHGGICIQVRDSSCAVRSCDERGDPAAVAKCGKYD